MKRAKADFCSKPTPRKAGLYLTKATVAYGLFEIDFDEYLDVVQAVTEYLAGFRLHLVSSSSTPPMSLH
jgi:hypothetical protein